ncbi:aldo/keto reductase [Phanerochaete sordida]|uniref:Aldo/keto reductase n=1 Tax=Phanerochaete sordida TaxID=48140 RepID=A0A9P3GIG5_9APHY|nr:aldo/keto reductase [Phanerochaete sordida]
MMTHSEPKSVLKVVLGTGNFGEKGAEGVRVVGSEAVGAIFDVFQAHGHDTLDTARIYTDGTSERVLGEAGWKSRRLLVDTKLYPTKSAPFPMPGLPLMSHKPSDLRKFLDESLKALQTDSVNTFYLHAPDRSTPFEETLAGIDALHKEGKFTYFGLSNYTAWEVAEVAAICAAHGYVRPSVYQGVYNAVVRGVEPELFPCLRKHNIAFYAFNPLGGGFFTGRYRSKQDTAEVGSRFDPSITLGQVSRLWYWHDEYFTGLAKIEAAAQKHGLTLAEVAMRWLAHHSLLKREHGDAVIIGASSVAQAEQNLTDLEKGPLPEDVVHALDEAWALAKGVAPVYFQ